MPEVLHNTCLLRSVDVILSCIVITPLTIIWWSGTWELIDVYLYPHSIWISSWISFAAGSFICVIGYFINPLLAMLVSEQRPLLRTITCRLFNYFFSLGVINFWRGVWQISDFMINHDKENKHIISAVIVFISETLLILLRTSGNNLSTPFWVNTEFGNTFHLATPRFNSKVNDLWWYTIDVFVTQFLIGTLVVQVWRGVWAVTTQTLSPDYNLQFHIICAAVGLSSCIFMHSINYPIYKLANVLHRLHPFCEYVYEVVVNFIAAVVGLILWVACWQMIKEDVLGVVVWRAWIFHITGFLGLLIMQASSILSPVHCHRDGEFLHGQGVWWDIDYVAKWRLLCEYHSLQLQVNVSEDDVEPILSRENNSSN